MPTFSEQLSAVRKERRITQEQLAQELNVSRTTISRWESGKALPDIETVKRLSQVLSFNFFAVEGLTEVPSAAPQEPENTPNPPAPRRGWGWLYALGCLCLLALCLILLSWRMEKSAGEGVNEGKSAAETETPAPTSAEIVVTPSKTVAYLDEFGEKGWGWDVNFVFENRSDVPFTPDRVVGYFYEDDELRGVATVTYEQLRPHMGNDKLLRINDPLEWPFGTDQLYLTHMECVIYGTDDYGNELQASATVQYSQEYARSKARPCPLMIFPVNTSVSPVMAEDAGTDELSLVYRFSIQNVSEDTTFLITGAMIELSWLDGAAPFRMEYGGEYVASALGTAVFKPGDGSLWMGSEPAERGFSGVTLTLTGVDDQGSEHTVSGHVAFTYPAE